MEVEPLLRPVEQVIPCADERIVPFFARKLLVVRFLETSGTIEQRRVVTRNIARRWVRVGAEPHTVPALRVGHRLPISVEDSPTLDRQVAVAIPRVRDHL